MSEKKVSSEKDCAVKLPEWVVDNMRHYGNCVIDTKLVKRCGLEPVRSALEQCCGRKVSMREFSGYGKDNDWRTDDIFAAKESSYVRKAWIAEVQR